MAHPKEDDNNFFFSVFMPLALRVLRFNYFVTSNNTLAFSTLFRVVEEFYDDIKNLTDDDERLKVMLAHCLKGFGDAPKIKIVNQAHANKIQKALGKLSFDERVSIGAVDCLGLDSGDVLAVLGKQTEDPEDEKSFEDNLAKTQNKLLKALKEKDYADVRAQLNGYFADTKVKREHEKKIQNLILPAYDQDADTSNAMRDAERRLFGERVVKFGGLGLLVIGLAVAVFMQQSNEDFTAKIIESLSYETIATEGDPDRLDFPTGSFSEVAAYFSNNRNLTIKPALLRQSSGWFPTSAGIIDYDFVQIAVSRYRRRGDSLYIYSFKGNVNSLAAETLSQDDFFYRSYSSPDLNMIVWEDEGIIFALASTLGGDDLVNLARKHID